MRLMHHVSILVHNLHEDVAVQREMGCCRNSQKILKIYWRSMGISRRSVGRGPGGRAEFPSLVLEKSRKDPKN